jgi:GxxExxY protein
LPCGTAPLPLSSRKRFTFFEEVDVGLHRLDLIVGGQIIVELKACKSLEDIHHAQVRSYMKATGLNVGLLLNLNASTLVVKRIVL